MLIPVSAVNVNYDKKLSKERVPCSCEQKMWVAIQSSSTTKLVIKPKVRERCSS